MIIDSDAKYKIAWEVIINEVLAIYIFLICFVDWFPFNWDKLSKKHLT